MDQSHSPPAFESAAVADTPSADSSPLGHDAHDEARRALTDVAWGRTRKIPVELLVDHALEVTAGGDWPVHLAALQALLRRLDAAHREGLRLDERPPGKALLGRYTTRRRKQSARPYTTQLELVSPLRGSCDCRDFLKNGLGACKHLLSILLHMAANKGRLARVLKATRDPDPRWRLAWCPVRPFTGAGDWLDQARLIPGSEPAERSAPTARLVDRWLREDPSGVWVPRATHSDDPARRLELVEALRAQLEPSGRRRPGPRFGPDPALVTLLGAEREDLRRRLQLAELRPALHRALDDLRRPLYPYQREGVEALWERGRLLLADDMGLGKTVQAAAACHALFHAGAVRRGLLIVPASLKSQWLREWRLFTDVPAEIVEGPPSERAALYRRTRSGFLIANYAQVLRDLDLMQSWKPQAVVLDEAQRIKNWATKTAGFVKRLRPAWRLVLTGTPMENRLDELNSVLEWVDERALEPKWRLGPWHTLQADGSQSGAVGARNLNVLRERIAPVFMRRTRREVLGQLPPRTDTMVPVALTPAQREEHEALNQPIASLASRARHRALTRAEFLRLMSLLTTQRIVANGIAQLEFTQRWPAIRDLEPTDSCLADLASPKLSELRTIISQLVVEQGRKVVVFSQWRRMLTLAEWATRGLLEQAGCRSMFFTGREPQRRRTQNVVDFHDDPQARVLFATDAGGVGLNLQRAASACINLELPWNPATLEQRIARIHRLGQTRPIDVYNLVSQGSIEERIASTLAAKSALFQGLFEGDSDEVRFDRAQGFMARLRELAPPDVAEPDGAADPIDEEDEHLDEELADREVDALIDAGDEELDADDEERDAGGAGGARDPDASGAEPDAGDAGLVGTQEPSSVAARPPAEDEVYEGAPQPAVVRELFASLSLSERPDGGIRIDAPPEAARTLASLFEGMAQLLRQGERPGT